MLRTCQEFAVFDGKIGHGRAYREDGRYEITRALIRI
jgi:hypothetical protein